MENRYRRGWYQERLIVQHRRKKVECLISSAKETLGVSEIIRIPNSDYPDGYVAGEVVVHFGLPIHYDTSDTKVVLARIIQNGHFLRNGEEKLPVLSFRNVWRALNLRTISQVSYSDIEEAFFKMSPIGKLADVAELKEMILSRYRKSLPDWSDKELLSQGVSIRKFELLSRVSYDSF
jgi:hypothetical protein